MKKQELDRPQLQRAYSDQRVQTKSKLKRSSSISVFVKRLFKGGKGNEGFQPKHDTVSFPLAALQPKSVALNFSNKLDKDEIKTPILPMTSECKRCTNCDHSYLRSLSKSSNFCSLDCKTAWSMRTGYRMESTVLENAPTA